MQETIFVCLRCFARSADPAVYRHPRSAVAGYEAETGEPLCQGCVDVAQVQALRRGWHVAGTTTWRLNDTLQGCTTPWRKDLYAACVVEVDGFFDGAPTVLDLRLK